MEAARSLYAIASDNNGINMADPRIPIVSFILCGRDDEYLGDFNYRISTAISFLCRSARLIERLEDIEVVVVDWGGTRPLSQAVTLTPECDSGVRFIVVPPEVAATRNIGDRSFNVPAAFNTGIRRARGRFIAIMSADVLFSRVALFNLMHLLEGGYCRTFHHQRMLVNIERIMLPPGLCNRRYTLDQWDRHLELHRHQCDYRRNLITGTSGGVGAILLPADLWQETEGFSEKYGGAYGWFDIELSLRINQRYPSIDSSNFGIVVFDMAPPRTRTQKGESNIREISFSFKSENDLWGLGEVHLEEQVPKSGKETSTVKPVHLPLDRKRIFDSIMRPRWISKVWHAMRLKESRTFDSLVLATARAKDNEWACYCAVSCLSRITPPQQYLEFGLSKGYCSLLLAGRNSAIEIFGVDDWIQKNDKILWMTSGIDRLSDFPIYRWFMKRSDLSGMIRYVTGDRNTALIRLRDSFGGSMSFEFVVFRTDMYSSGARKQLKDVASCLREGGTLVITGADRDRFEACLETIAQEIPQSVTFICRRRGTAVVIRDTGDSEGDLHREETLLARAWRKPIAFVIAGRLIPVLVRLRRRWRTIFRSRSQDM